MTSYSLKTAGKATGVIVLADGTVFYGKGFGAISEKTGEICFNTSLTGYQEILTDPSYASQIITFTFPHIGNTGTNLEDIETLNPYALGLITRELPTEPSNWRNRTNFPNWLIQNNIVGIAGIDTRALTKRIRDIGAPNGVIAHNPVGAFDVKALKEKAAAWPGLNGMDLAKDVSCTQTYSWTEKVWRPENTATSSMSSPPPSGDPSGRPLKAGVTNRDIHIVAIDYGAKRNILRCLASTGARVTVVPATASAEDIMSHKPDGVFLSNGPGDPAATGVYAVPVIQDILKKNVPIFGICLGHQLLALSLGAKTTKMKLGHRGANHPVKDIQTGRVEITSQNHGFHVLPETLPAEAEVTHVSLFDGTNEGFKLKNRPVFSVQYHPEASPGPHDSHYLFDRFINMIEGKKPHAELSENSQRAQR